MMGKNATMSYITFDFSPTHPSLVDVHVYVIPEDQWNRSRRLAKSAIAATSISSGFVRAMPDLTLLNFRKEIALQLGPTEVPNPYIFVRCVGKHFTQVRPQQEHYLKVKNFVPPFNPEPAIFVVKPAALTPSSRRQLITAGMENANQFGRNSSSNNYGYSQLRFLVKNNHNKKKRMEDTPSLGRKLVVTCPTQILLDDQLSCNRDDVHPGQNRRGTKSSRRISSSSRVLASPLYSTKARWTAFFTKATPRLTGNSAVRRRKLAALQSHGKDELGILNPQGDARGFAEI
ncbi:unnamed protein product [Notodromas monacha]|uniref:Uncharacterized protein n=1 Tax=Notodromas monacha TaxID=399045 RepID=A0A7R9BZZ0_9CRUS|nr:unnamed protein product [Notodromas monacha]CAG0923450.1 unnamed protein product [Notodromas monacha]